MANYTTLVKSICEMISKKHNVNDCIDNSVETIFNFSFPIFDENYRKVLEKKILKHYYFNEIGLETFELWRARLDTKLNEIMPFYNQKYLTQWETVKRDYDTNITTKGDGTNKQVGKSSSLTNTDSNSNSNQTQTQSNRVINSDYPQSGTPLMTGTYASDGSESSSTLTNNNNDIANIDQNSSTNAESNGEIHNETVVTGLSGRYLESDILKSYRDSIINIDMEIIYELRDLFMLIW